MARGGRRTQGPVRAVPLGSAEAATVRVLERRPWLVGSGLVAIHLVLAALSFLPFPQPAGDNAVYLALAHSLLEGGYKDLFDPLTPSHVQWPPLWPMVIAAALALGVEGWIGIKVVVVGLSAVGVGLTYAWIRRRGQPVLAAVVTLLLAISPGVVALSHWELSDTPFWAATAAALLLWQYVPRERVIHAVPASIAALVAHFTRTAGLPLLVAAAIWLTIERRWRQLGVFALIVLPPSIVWRSWKPDGGGYESVLLLRDAYDPSAGEVDATGLVSRIGENATSYASNFLPILIGGMRHQALTVVAVAVIALALWGWVRRLRRPGVAELWVPLYAAMLLLWNSQWAGDRLLLPMYGALLVYAAEGLVALVGTAPRLRVAPVAAAATVFFTLATIPGNAYGIRVGSYCTEAYRAGDPFACMPDSWRHYLGVARYARTNLPEGSVVLSRKPAFFWVESGLTGRTYPLSRDPDELLSAASEIGARYVVLDEIDRLATLYLTPAIARRSRAFCVIHVPAGTRTALMGIKPNAASMPDDRVDPGEGSIMVNFDPCGPEFSRPTADSEAGAGP